MAYNPNKLRIIVDGFVVTARPTDSEVSVVRDEDQAVITPGTNGVNVPALNPGTAGRATFSVFRDSPDRAFLEQLAKSQAAGLKTGITCKVEDNSSTVKDNSVVSDAFIQKLPDKTFPMSGDAAPSAEFVVVGTVNFQ